MSLHNWICYSLTSFINIGIFLPLHCEKCLCFNVMTKKTPKDNNWKLALLCVQIIYRLRVFNPLIYNYKKCDILLYLNKLGQGDNLKNLKIPTLYHDINTDCICCMLCEAEQQFLICLYTKRQWNKLHEECTSAFCMLTQSAETLKFNFVHFLLQSTFPKRPPSKIINRDIVQRNWDLAKVWSRWRHNSSLGLTYMLLSVSHWHNRNLNRLGWAEFNQISTPVSTIHIKKRIPPRCCFTFMCYYLTPTDKVTWAASFHPSHTVNPSNTHLLFSFHRKVLSATWQNYIFGNTDAITQRWQQENMT